MAAASLNRVIPRAPGLYGRFCASAFCRSPAGAPSGQVGTPSGSFSQGCFRLTQMWTTRSSSSLRSATARILACHSSTSRTLFEWRGAKRCDQNDR